MRYNTHYELQYHFMRYSIHYVVQYTLCGTVPIYEEQYQVMSRYSYG